MSYVPPHPEDAGGAGGRSLNERQAAFNRAPVLPGSNAYAKEMEAKTKAAPNLLEGPRKLKWWNEPRANARGYRNHRPSSPHPARPKSILSHSRGVAGQVELLNAKQRAEQNERWANSKYTEEEMRRLYPITAAAENARAAFSESANSGFPLNFSSRGGPVYKPGATGYPLNVGPGGWPMEAQHFTPETLAAYKLAHPKAPGEEANEEPPTPGAGSSMTPRMGGRLRKTRKTRKARRKSHKRSRRN